MKKILLLPLLLNQSFALFSQQIDHTLSKPVKASVIRKAATNASFSWAIYGDTDMKREIGRAQPGDSVEILGWAPWLVKIKTQGGEGYISWLSVQVTPALKELIQTIRDESPVIETNIRVRDSIRFALKTNYWIPAQSLHKPLSENAKAERTLADSLEVYNSGKTFLRLTSSNKKIYQGECTVLDLALYIHPENTRLLRFHELRSQLANLIDNFQKPDVWNTRTVIMNVEHEPVKIGNNEFSTYSIYRAAHCPTKSTTISFAPVTLEMLERFPKESVPQKLVNFTSNKIDVSVVPQPQKVSLTGNFVLIDSLASTHVVSGDKVRYSVTVMGEGLTFFLKPPELSDSTIYIELEDLQISDTIINQAYYSRKTFVYQLTFSNAGTYNLSDKFSFSFFNPATKAIVNLMSEKQISVTGAPVRRVSKPASRKNVIAIDVSQSMEINDYKPSRLNAVTTGVSKFLETSKRCDIDLMIFGGTASRVLPGSDSCYSAEQIKTISGLGMIRGTAIGDAIGLGSQVMDNSDSIKKIVIIGDGDNTAGFMSPAYAVTVAKENKIIIYTIGVGTKGLVSYGVDERGNPTMVENTFTDIVFKSISQSTGGKYYWAKDADAVTAILREIFIE